MKKILLAALVVIGLGMAVNLQAADKPQTGTLRHVVVFKYKPTASPQQIQKVTDDFRALKKTIPGIVSFETGTNVSPENLNQGFTHVYILTFKTAKARDAYLVHPEHKKFAESLGPVLAEPFVVDFWAGK